MKFNKYDVVECISSEIIVRLNGLLIDTRYVIEDQDNEFVYLFNDSIGNNCAGYFPYRFKKVPKEDLTEEDKFRIIKYKLGCKNEI